MGKAGALVTAAVVLSASLLTVGAAGASAAAGETTQGVTATTIRIGVPYVDLSAVRKFGITLDHGDYTAAYIAPLIARPGLTITRLARGLPIGGDLEYADEGTLSRALEGRQQVREP